jgi:hypothetical protein
VALEVDHAGAGESIDERLEGPAQTAPDRVAVDSDVFDARDRLESSCGWIARELDLDVMQTQTRRADRTIAARSQMCSTSDRTCDDKKTVAPRSRAARTSP